MADLDDDLERLRRLGKSAKELRYPGAKDAEYAEGVRMERDGLIYKLAWEGLSASRIAHVADVHRVFVYRVKDNYPARLARWRKRQVAEK